MFNLSNQSLAYGDKNILHNISLNIKPGEVVALVGESGSGKSTLINHLRSLRPNDVAWCPQQSGLVPTLSAFHNIYAGTLNSHNIFYNLRTLLWPSAAELSKVEAVARKLTIHKQLRVSIDRLSGGQQQRVNIARAMIQSRPVFFGDEPVSSQDEYHSHAIINTIIAAHETCVFALHDLELARTCCQRIIGIAEGAILFDAKVENISDQQLASIYRHHPSLQQQRLASERHEEFL
jgi:phosphonate transport system ATP-binding protein